MPELAEVEYARKLAHRFLVGRRILTANCANDCDNNVFANNRVRLNDDSGRSALSGAAAVCAVLANSNVIDARRKGKNLFVFVQNSRVQSLFPAHDAAVEAPSTCRVNHLSTFHVLHIHFGMSGQFFSRKLAGETFGKYGIVQTRGQGDEAAQDAPAGQSHPTNNVANWHATHDKRSTTTEKHMTGIVNRSVIFQELKDSLGMDSQWPPRFSKLLLKTQSIVASPFSATNAGLSSECCAHEGCVCEEDEFSYDDSRKFGFINVLTNHYDGTAGFDCRDLFAEYASSKEISDANSSLVDFLFSRTLVVVRLKPDPFSELPTPHIFSEMLEQHRFQRKATSGLVNAMPIKTLLLDQGSILCGIGNWLVDEILFDAKIHPNETVNSIIEQGQGEVLRRSIKRVIGQACYADANADLFPDHWLFHVRWTLNRGSKSIAEKCQAVKHFDKGASRRSELDIITVGQRTTVLDKRSQVLTATSAMLAEARAMKAAKRKSGTSSTGELKSECLKRAKLPADLEEPTVQATVRSKVKLAEGEEKSKFPRLWVTDVKPLTALSEVAGNSCNASMLEKRVFTKLVLSPQPVFMEL